MKKVILSLLLSLIAPPIQAQLQFSPQLSGGTLEQRTLDAINWLHLNMGSGGGGNNAYCPDATGSTSAYTCTGSPAVSTLTGLIVSFVPLTTNNTGTSTLNVSGLGAKTLKQLDCTTNVASGALIGGTMYLFSYNGTYFCQSSSGGGSSSSAPPDTVTFNTAGSTCSGSVGSCTASPSCGTGSGPCAVVTHNLGTSQPWLVCFDGSGNLLGGATASTSVVDLNATSANALTITFSAATSGKCLISTGSQGSSGLAGAGYGGTSTTSNTIASGSVTFATQSGLAYLAGARVRATSSASGAYMEGVVTSYSGTTLVFTSDTQSGSGAHSDWNFNLAGNVGAAGSGMGDPGANGIPYRSALNTTVPATATNLSALVYAVGGGSAQAQTVTLSPAVTSLTDGLSVCWLPIAANTGAAPTLAVNGLTATAITKLGTTALSASDITTSAVACAIYRSSGFQLQNPQTVPTGGGSTITAGTYASLPGTCTTGASYYFTDSVYNAALCTSTNNWTLFAQGKQMYLPSAFTWSQVNFGSSTVSTAQGGIMMNLANSTVANLVQYVHTAPATPWTATVYVVPQLWGNNSTDFPSMGIVATDNTKIISLDIEMDGTGKPRIEVVKWNNATTLTPGAVATQYLSYQNQSGVWLQVSNNGTNLVWSWSADGIQFDQLFSEGSTAYLSAVSKIGIGGQTFTSTAHAAMHLISWQEH